jgi:hypothetical protein
MLAHKATCDQRSVEAQKANALEIVREGRKSPRGRPKIHYAVPSNQQVLEHRQQAEQQLQQQEPDEFVPDSGSNFAGEYSPLLSDLVATLGECVSTEPEASNDGRVPDTYEAEERIEEDDDVNKVERIFNDANSEVDHADRIGNGQPAAARRLIRNVQENVDEDEDSGEELFGDNFERDYLPRPGLDVYEPDQLDQGEYSDMSFSDRIAAEAVLKARDKAEDFADEEEFPILSAEERAKMSRSQYRRYKKKRNKSQYVKRQKTG